MPKKKLHPAEQYARDILDEKILSCKYVKNACDRYFKDREFGEERGIYFNEKKAIKAINFSAALKHFKSDAAGKSFIQEPWQQFITWNLYGFERANGKRRFTQAYISIPKKNGKSTYAAFIAVKGLMVDGEAAAEIYTAATTRDQAKEVFTFAKKMLEKSQLKSYVQLLAQSITFEEAASFLRPLSSEADSFEGKNPHVAIIDEYHVNKTDELYTNIKSAMVARPQPLILVITTRGYNKNGPCYQMDKIAIKILDGSLEQDNFFSVIYTIDESDNWEDPKNWAKANPNYGISVLPDALKDNYIDAVNDPTKQVPFKTKNLNLWVDSEKTWIPDKDFMKCAFKIDLEKLIGRKCYGGLDLASVNDTTSLILVFPDEETEMIDVLCFFWLPDMTYTIRIKKDGVNYDIWANDGFIDLTPGNVTDYNYIFSKITGFTKNGDKTTEPGIADLYNLQSIAYDRYNATQLVIDLTDAGIEMSKFGQGFVSMSTPTKAIQKLMLSGKFNHGGNPVLRWQCGNVHILRDAADNIKIDKSKSSDKVDGMVALAMAYGEYLTAQSEGGAKDQLFFI
jgi:phage terminase large subunit-like protein